LEQRTYYIQVIIGLQLPLSEEFRSSVFESSLDYVIFSEDKLVNKCIDLLILVTGTYTM